MPTGPESFVDLRVIVGDLSGAPLEEVPFDNLQYSFILNSAGSCFFNIPLRHAKATTTLLKEGQRSITIIRNGIAVWGGWLWSVNPSYGEGKVQMNAEGWLSRLRYRYYDATKTWASTEQFDIAWDLISYTQAKTFGSLGIGRYGGEVPSGITRTKTLNAFERKNIGEALEEMAGVQGGFDFEITPDRLWRPYYPRKGARTNHVFALGKNIGGISYQGDASKTATEITAIGAGDENSTLLAVASDASKMAEYGRLEDTVSFTDVSVQATLTAHAAEELRVRKTSRVQPEISVTTNDPPFGLYQVGDEVLLDVREGFFDLYDYFRIITIVVAASNAGREAITVFFDPNLSGATL